MAGPFPSGAGSYSGASVLAGPCCSSFAQSRARPPRLGTALSLTIDR